MVFFFYPRGFTNESGKDEWLIYMGKDKYENEDLIKYGWPTDVWFHVDDMSSAHVYLRLPEGQSVEDIPPDTLEDCAQLVKANSIQGCKTNNVTIVYTPWANLRKTADMDVGQIGFHDQKQVKKVKIDRKNNDIVNRLNKTMKEEFPDFQADREAYDAYIRSLQRADQKAKRQVEKAAKEEQKRVQDLRSYKTLFADETMVSNKQLAEKYDSIQDLEDDFM